MIALAAAQKVADAVLCEGQVLYPYRATATKNQLRWQFGVIAPRRFSEGADSDRWYLRARCLLDRARDGDEVMVRARFVRTRARVVEIDGTPVDRLDAGGRLWTSFDETVEDRVDAGPLRLGALLEGPVTVPFHRLPAEARSRIPGAGNGTVTYSSKGLDGCLEVVARAVPGPFGLLEVDTRLVNLTEWDAGPGRSRALGASMISAHLLLAAGGGRWLSVIDPPEFARGLVGPADQEGCLPVLIGDDRVVLAAPIILYDHPEVAPESPGDFCDATEIDEILALRTLTLTDDEKREARSTDRRAAGIIDRCDEMPPEVWARLHGAVREMVPKPGEESVVVDGREIRTGTRVELHPSGRADAQDLFLDGRSATVSGVYRDFDAEVHVAVVLDDDPGADLHEWYGRYRYFKPDELVVIP